jgi:phosphoglycerate dehydrogenase-like enzyme
VRLVYDADKKSAARLSKALGMDVIAYTASPRTTPESKRETGYTVPGTGDDEGVIPSAWYSGLDKASLHHFLKQDIDVLLIAVPLTPQTHHFLGKEEFEILGKKNAFIVNIARGPIVKTDDLITAVKKSPKEGGLRGAALDVTEPEPLPEDSELWDVENIAVTPHVSGMGDTYADRAFAILDINLTNLEKGKPLINVVSRKKGY